MSDKIWLSSPHMGGNELKYIHEAFDANWVAPLGPNVNGFEEDIQEYLKKDVKVAALSSGTAALHLALIECGVGYADEVICQSLTFSASANPIVYLGATPIFVDSEEDTWNICPQALEEAIIDRLAKGKLPKAIIAVHLYGMPYKVEEVHAIALKYNIPVIEDAAEALGSTYKGQSAATFGNFAALSFNGNKIITTSGGGALVCKSQVDKDRAVYLATQARDNAVHYQHTEIGYNYRMSNISAGIGRGQMEVLDAHIEARRDMNSFYQALFADIKGVKVFVEPSLDYFSNHWLTAILIDPKLAGVSREDLRLALLDDNIESRPLWKPMHLQPVFSNCPFYGTGLSEQLFNEGLCLPSGSNLTANDRSRIERAIKGVFNC